uniref:Uncharacterized protein n=1 Tax=Pararge aegeria TaxID=116150 RepID=S4PS21_9NEOP
MVQFTLFYNVLTLGRPLRLFKSRKYSMSGCHIHHKAASSRGAYIALNSQIMVSSKGHIADVVIFLHQP